MPARLVAVLLLLCVLPSAATSAAGARVDRGSAVVFDSASGREVARLSANGALVTAVADGRGGWFVGGSFTRIGGQSRVAIAHLLRSGVVDPAWRSSIGSASGRAVAVDALARAGSRLFVAGSFGRVGGLDRRGWQRSTHKREPSFPGGHRGRAPGRTSRRWPWSAGACSSRGTTTIRYRGSQRSGLPRPRSIGTGTRTCG